MRKAADGYVRKYARKMVGAVQIFSVLVALSISLPSRAAPIPASNEVPEFDTLALIATGVLSQEKRLQALEEKVAQLTAVPAAVGGAQVRGRLPTLQNEELDIATRVQYLEEDLHDFKGHTNHHLLAVKDQLTDLQRIESEDLRNMHNELNSDVATLEKEVNTSFQHAEHDIDTVGHQVKEIEMEVTNNEAGYNHLRNGLLMTIHYIDDMDYALDDRIYVLETKLKEIMQELLEIQRRHDEEEHASQQPQTGGIQSHEGSHTGTMSGSEKALREWMREDATAHASSPGADKGAMPAYFAELLNELKNSNM